MKNSIAPAWHLRVLGSSIGVIYDEATIDIKPDNKSKTSQSEACI
jgi:hypothetical protein